MGNSSCYVYSCNLFTITVNNETRVATVAAFNATSTNPKASLSNVVVNWGDNSSAVTTGPSPVGQSHTFTVDSATITATAQFTTPDSTTPVSSTVCTQPVNFTTTPPVVTPPTELPNTGAGNVIGIIFGTVIAGTIAARVMTLRKLSRN